MEIERKFLVPVVPAFPEEYVYIRQGYIPTAPGFCVRVRLTGTHLAVLQQAELTVKQDVTSTTRHEFNAPLKLADAQALYALVQDKVEKMRYRLSYKGHVWELDVFQQRHQGLVTAEIELQSENEIFEQPSWVGAEVTGDLQYRNDNLAKVHGRWIPRVQ